MNPALDDYNWAEAFGYAGAPDRYGEGLPVAVGDTDVSVAPFTREDVNVLKHAYEGEHDGDDWVCVGQLRDGRWFALNAGCDYTGWD